MPNNDRERDQGADPHDGKPDIGKIRPLVFAPEARCYYGVGDCVGKAFEIGKKE